jgi:hypothetical protein
MKRVLGRMSAAIVLAAVTAACFPGPGSQAQSTAQQEKPGNKDQARPRPNIAELWEDPGDVTSRDLFYGRGGKALLPSPTTEYQFMDVDTIGYSRGYDVVDPQGREWKVKTGDEAQPEVVANRVLWVAGYRQPVVYFMPEWKLKGGPVATPVSGRFRYEEDHKNLGDWSWTENPFFGTREFKGLVITNLVLNNWDIKQTNNRIYEMVEGFTPSRWFVAQDIGASLGKTAWPVGNRNNVDDFERQRFVLGVENGRVQFDYHARHRELLADIAPADVVWICRILDKISDRQWDDAFRGAAFPKETADRYIRKLKSKIQEGLALTATTSVDK